MGSQICSYGETDQNSFQNFLKQNEYTKIYVKTSDPIFLEPTIYKSLLEHKSLAYVRIPLKNRSKFARISEKLKNYINHEHENIISIRFYDEIIQKSTLISNNVSVGLVFDYHYYNLLNNLESIARKGLFYKEEEIWYILNSLLEGLNYLKENGGFHNNLKLDTIIITAEGILKILPNHLLGKKGMAFYQMQEYLNNSFDYCYLSPHLLTQLSYQKKIKIEKTWKNDVFSIGILGLELCTLKNALICFDFENKKIKTEQIKLFLQKVEEKYSSHLKSFLEKMIITEEISDVFLTDRISELKKIAKSKNLVSSLKNSSHFADDYEEAEEKMDDTIKNIKLKTVESGPKNASGSDFLQINKI